jgi:hypothetical protein
MRANYSDCNKFASSLRVGACSLGDSKKVSFHATRAVFSSKKKHYAKKKFSVISNLRYMHEVLNVDEIKN